MIIIIKLFNYKNKYIYMHYYLITFKTNNILLGC